MGRPLRRIFPGDPAHVWHRGNNKQAIFRDEGDFRFYWRCLFEASAKAGVAVNCYVFMTNHVHLLVTPATGGSVSKMMHSAQGRYANYYNRRYGRSGALWGGRFRSSNITEDRYLVACHRYVDMNPVRARMVSSPESHPWSSHRFYAFEEFNPLISPNPAFVSLVRPGAAYRALFESDLAEADIQAIREAISRNRNVGEPARPRGRRAKLVPGTISEIVPGTNLLRTGDGAQLRAGEVALQEGEAG